MTRSRLEKYFSILEVLVPQPLKFENISYETDIECNTLKRYLGFLISHKLVEERHLNRKKVLYGVTPKEGWQCSKHCRRKNTFKNLKVSCQ